MCIFLLIIFSENIFSSALELIYIIIYMKHYFKRAGENIFWKYNK